MDNNSMDKQLYDFLNGYNLIQADLTEEEAVKKIAEAMDQLSEGENILTGFVAGLDNNLGKNTDHAFLITDNRRIIYSPVENVENTPIIIDEIETIEIGDAFNQNKIKVKSNNNEINLVAKSDDGSDSLNDALYSALSELLTNEKIGKIFDIESEEIETPAPEKPAVSEEKAEPAPAEEPEKTKEITPEPTPIPEPIEEKKEEPITPEPEPHDKSTTASSDSFLSEAKKDNKIHIGKFSFSKPAFFVGGAVILVVVAVLGYYLFSSVSESNLTKSNGKKLVELFNQIDDIYYQAAEYQAAGAGGSTPEQWQELDNKAIEIQNELNSLKINEASDSLFQAVYFYNDSLMTALYYGQSFATTGNPVQQRTLEQRMNSAYQNRIAALSFIESDYPDLLDSVTHDTSLDDEINAYPQREEIEALLEQANSQPSEGALNRENTESSNEARENSVNSRESRESD